jgi:metal-dependent amidase/aminoacylase/carboxypeptidase family protein
LYIGRCRNLATIARGPRRPNDGARPQTGVDPVLVVAHRHRAAEIVSRNLRPIDAAVASVTKINRGDAYNVIPQTA